MTRVGGFTLGSVAGHRTTIGTPALVTIAGSTAKAVAVLVREAEIVARLSPGPGNWDLSQGYSQAWLYAGR